MQQHNEARALAARAAQRVVALYLEWEYQLMVDHRELARRGPDVKIQPELAAMGAGIQLLTDLDPDIDAATIRVLPHARAGEARLLRQQTQKIEAQPSPAVVQCWRDSGIGRR